MPNIKRIDHIAILVENLEESLSFWQEAFGMELSHIEDIPSENSKVAFLQVGGNEIELILPTTTDSGLARYLEKHGPGMHHLCLEVDDIDEMLMQLKSKGIQLINQTAVLDSVGKKFAFIHPKSTHGVMVELYELPIDRDHQD